MDRVRTGYYILKYQVILRKVRFGKNCLVKCRLCVKGPGKVWIGDNCIFMPDPWGDDYVTLYTHRKHARIVIRDHVVLRATRFGSHLGIEIGNHAVLETASVFDSDFHNLEAARRDEGFNVNDRRVLIGSEAYVGCESLCSKGTELGSGAVMTAVSVAGTRHFPDHSKIGGFPARKVT